jgi:DNA-binding NtrC family response regulator
MVEAELFGVVKGYATDVQPRAGRLRDADTGTMFLDEIGDVPMSIQNKLVTVLEDQAFVPLGTARTVYTDIRFIYATNRNLQQLVAEGKFRQDLFHRINRIAIEIPPLRERPGDIMLLLEHFVRRFGAGRIPPKFSTEALELFHSYQWPGNVRELKNLVERLCVLYPGQRITRRQLPPEFFGKPLISDGTDGSSAAAERIRVQDMLVKCGWNLTRTAAALGIARNTLKARIRKFGIKRPA